MSAESVACENLPVNLRREQGVVYVDESGQMRFPRAGQAHETALIAAFFAKDVPVMQGAIREVGSLLANSPKNEVPDDTLDEVAELIREHGYAAFAGVELELHHQSTFEAMHDAMPAFFDQARGRLVGGKGLDLRLDSLRRQYLDESSRHPVYIPMLVHMFIQVARRFKANGILPALSVVLDKKLPHTAHELQAFLLRFAVCSEFPEVYGQRLGAVLGVDPLPELTCRTGTDDRDAGLRIAHVLAYAKGMCLRSQDTDGRYARFCASIYRPSDDEGIR